MVWVVAIATARRVARRRAARPHPAALRLKLRDDQPPRLNLDPRLAARNKTRIVDQPHSTNLHVRIKPVRSLIRGLRGTPHFLDRDETFRLRWSCFMIRLSHGQLPFSWLWCAVAFSRNTSGLSFIPHTDLSICTSINDTPKNSGTLQRNEIVGALPFLRH